MPAGWQQLLYQGRVGLRSRIGHLGWIIDEPREVVPGELGRPVRRLTHLGDSGAALRRIEVGEMAGRLGAVPGETNVSSPGVGRS